MVDTGQAVVGMVTTTDIHGCVGASPDWGPLAEDGVNRARRACGRAWAVDGETECQGVEFEFAVGCTATERRNTRDISFGLFRRRDVETLERQRTLYSVRV